MTGIPTFLDDRFLNHNHSWDSSDAIFKAEIYHQGCFLISSHCGIKNEKAEPQNDPAFVVG